MGSIIDIIGALIAGGLIIITIILTINNVRIMDYNIQTELNLHTAALKVPEVLEVGYLESLGRLTNRSDVPISIASPNQFQFFGITINAAGNLEQVIYTLESALIPNTNFFHVRVITQTTTTPPITNQTYTTQPYQFENGNIFTYFDGNNNSLGSTVIGDDLDLIRSVQVDLMFIEPAAGRTDAFMRYPITFWRYFKNLYIRDYL